MNIIFDLGGVLYTWRPRELAARYFSHPREKELVWEHLQAHRDWDELDRGTLGYQEAALRAGERSGLDHKLLEQFLDGVPHALKPVRDTVSLLAALKEAGHKLYLLSNMHSPARDHLENYPFMNLFDGKVYSCDVKMIKPEKAIFETLLTRYRLNPEETVFIDDTVVNIEAAAEMGIRGIHFTTPADCASKLKELGVSLTAV